MKPDDRHENDMAMKPDDILKIGFITKNSCFGFKKNSLVYPDTFYRRPLRRPRIKF